MKYMSGFHKRQNSSSPTDISRHASEDERSWPSAPDVHLDGSESSKGVELRETDIGLRFQLDPTTPDLQPPKPGVAAVPGQQLRVGALFDDAAAIEDDDAIRHANDRQTVGDDERRPPLSGPLECLEHALLAGHVQSCRGLVED